MSTSPSDLLVAAADRVRDLASKWEAENTRQEVPLYEWGEVVGYVVDEYSDPALEAAEAWVAALSPAVSPHLEALFRGAAELWWERWDEECPPMAASLLELAKLICPELGVGSQ